MRPVTDRHGIPRSKLAYIIDSTAAPVCIIAPISSWAAAVTGFVDDNAANGLALFIQAIPYNLYAILTLTMLIALALLKFDFGPMAAADDIVPFEEASTIDTKGSIVDLLIPIAALIVCCTLGMLYTGDFFAGADFVTAFSNSDASVGLVFAPSARWPSPCCSISCAGCLRCASAWTPCPPASRPWCPPFSSSPLPGRSRP